MGSARFVAFGFLFVFLALHFAEGCGWNTTALSGIIQSPNFPNNYTNGQSCVYIITAPSNYRVTLTFTHFDLEAHVNCLIDYLEIRDGDSQNSPSLGRFCNITIPHPRRTFSHQMWVKFVSDGNVTRSGFRATYIAAPDQYPFFLMSASVNSSFSGGFIYRMDAETRSNYNVPMPSPPYTPIAVDYDPVNKIIYWTEVGRFKGIRASTLNGSSTFFVKDLGAGSTPDGLAVDPASRLIFYTDAGRDVIAMMTMTTFAHKTIISSSLDQPRAIVLDTANGVMFWTDWGSSAKIERANYDGSDRRTVVDYFLLLPNALALDSANNRLYWADAGTDLVEMSDMEGIGRTTLLSADSFHQFFGVALLEDSLYITDWLAQRPKSNFSVLVRLRLGDRRNVSVVGTLTGKRVNDIHAYSPQLFSNNSVNGCGDDNGGCAVFCIPLPGNSSKCMCPDGQSLTSDQTTCVHGLYTTTSTTVMRSTTTQPPATTTTTTSSTEVTTSSSISITGSTTLMSTTNSAPLTSTATTTTTTTTTMDNTAPTPLPFSVVVSTSDPQPFDTKGDHEMTLTCDLDLPVQVISYTWSVSCLRQTGNTCVFTPQPVQDDGKAVTCTVTSSDGETAMGMLEIELNYPPEDAPTINGHSKVTVYQEGDALTMTCSVYGGKPLVTSVLFSCGSHLDTSPDIFSTTEVHSILTIDPLTVKDNGKVCFCTATWKDTDWYKLSATAVLRVNGSQPTTIGPAESTTTAPSLNIPVVVGIAAGAVVVFIVVIIIIVYVVIKRRRRKRKENPYHVPHAPRPPARHNRPFLVNRAFEDGNESHYDEIEYSSNYDTLSNVAPPISGSNDYLTPKSSGLPTACPATSAPNDYLTPQAPLQTAVPSDLKKGPAPCAWGKKSPSEDSYLHPVPSSAHNDYSPLPTKREPPLPTVA